MNYFPFHVGDYAAATAHLSWDEDMAYTRLLRAYYLTEQPIPLDKAYRLARATTPAQRKAVDTVLSEFFNKTEAGYQQGRCDAEIAKFQDKQEKAQRSANARWKAPTKQTERNANASQHGDANGMRTHSDGNANHNQEPITNNQIQGEGVVIGESARTNPTPADVCKAMKSAGMATVNPSSPKLASVLAAGVTLPELAQAAADAVEQGKGFAYALAMAEGRRSDAFAPAKQQAKQSETFAERDARIGRERWEQMTGRTHPDNLKNTATHGGMVVDISPVKLEFQA